MTIQRKTQAGYKVVSSLIEATGVVTDKSTGTIEWVMDIQLPELTKQEMEKLNKAHKKSAPNYQRAKEVKAVYRKGDSVNDVMKKIGSRHSRTMVAIDMQAFRQEPAPINIK